MRFEGGMLMIEGQWRVGRFAAVFETLYSREVAGSCRPSGIFAMGACSGVIRSAGWGMGQVSAYVWRWMTLSVGCRVLDRRGI